MSSVSLIHKRQQEASVLKYSVTLFNGIPIYTENTIQYIITIFNKNYYWNKIYFKKTTACLQVKEGTAVD